MEYPVFISQTKNAALCLLQHATAPFCQSLEIKSALHSVCNKHPAVILSADEWFLYTAELLLSSNPGQFHKCPKNQPVD